jgi:hypothetical protein
VDLSAAKVLPDMTPGWYPDPLGGSSQRYFDGAAWTDQIQKAQPADVSAPKKKAWWRPGWRKMTWAILIFSVLMLIWIIAGAGASDNHGHCLREHGVLSVRSCEDARDVGTGIAVGLIAFLWFVGFVILSIIWFMTRPKGRECPVCGERVKKGRTVCAHCSYDFAAAAGHEPQVAH